MKASADKTTDTNSATATRATKEPFFAKSGEGGFFESAKQAHTPFIQTKLTINEPGDPYEQEADRMADQVVQRLAMPSQEGAKSPLSPTSHQSSGTIQTKCDACEQEEKIQRKEEEVPEEQEEIQRKEESASPSPPSDDGLSTRLNASKGGGSPLPKDTRADMESAFGADFSGVRVHTGGEAHNMSERVHAKAFTHGQDLYFKDGNYNPASNEGTKLLAHELVHTMQQGEGVNRKIQRKPDWNQSDWIKAAIDYNNKNLNIKFRTEYIWHLFLLSTDSDAKNDASSEQDFNEGFAHLVHINQMLIFPEEFIENKEMSQDSGKLNKRIYKAVLVKLLGQPIDDTLFENIWYNVNVYSLDIKGQDYVEIQSMLTASKKTTILTTNIPEYFITLYYGELQNFCFLDKSKFVFQRISSKEIPEMKKHLNDKGYLKNLNLPLLNSPINEGFFAEKYYDQMLIEKAPDWLWSEIEEQVVENLDFFEYEDIKKTGNLTKKPEKSFNKLPDEIFKDDLDKYYQTTKLVASGLGGKEVSMPPAQRLMIRQITYSRTGEILDITPAKNDNDAKKMIKLVFNALLQQKIDRDKSDNAKEEAKAKLNSYKVFPVSSTGYTYYSTHYREKKEELIEAYSQKITKQYENEFSKKFDLKKKPIQKRYEATFIQFTKKKETEYEPQMVDALRTGDSVDDIYVSEFRNLQIEKGYALTEKQQVIENRKQSEIGVEQKRLDNLMQTELEAIVKDLQAYYSKSFAISMAKQSAEPFFITKSMLDAALNNIDKKKIEDRKDPSIKSADYSSRLQTHIFEEWHKIPFSEEFIEIMNKNVLYEPDKENFFTRYSIFETDLGIKSRPVQSTPISRWIERQNQWREDAKAEFYSYAIGREMVMADGRPTLTAMKWWAGEWYSFVTEQIGTLDPEIFKGEISLYEDAQVHLLDIITSIEKGGENSQFFQDFSTGFFAGNPFYIIPFIGGVLEIIDIWQIIEVAKLYNEGKELTPGQTVLLQSFSFLQDLESRVSSIGMTLGAGLKEAIPFLFEAYFTAGIFSAIKATTVKLGLKVTKKVFLKKGVGKMIKKGVIEVTSFTVASSIQMIANPQIWFKEFSKNLMPTYLAFMDGQGLVVLQEVGEPKSLWEALGDAMVKSGIDFWSEHLAGFILKQHKAIIARILVKEKRIANSVIVNWMVRHDVLHSSVLNQSFKKTFHLLKDMGKGILKEMPEKIIRDIGEEFFEEYLAARLSDAYDGKPFEILKDEDLNTLMSVIMLSGLGQAVGVARKTYSTLEAGSKNITMLVSVMENGKEVIKEIALPAELIEGLDNLHREKGFHPTDALEIIETSFNSNAEYKNKSETEKKILKSYLMSYHMFGGFSPETADWALDRKAKGNFDVAFALIHLQGPNPVNAGHIEQLRKVPEFAATADTLEVALQYGTESSVLVRMQNLLGSKQIFNQTETGQVNSNEAQDMLVREKIFDQRRIEIAGAWKKGMQYLQRPLTLAELDGELAVVDQHAGLPTELRPIHYHLRLPGENSIDFLKRTDVLRADLTLAEFLELNRDDIMKFRLSDTSYKSLNALQRPDANELKFTGEFKIAKSAYQTGLIDTGDKNLSEFAFIETFALEGEMQSELMSEIFDTVNMTEGFLENAGKRSKKNFYRTKEKLRLILNDSALSNEQKIKEAMHLLEIIERKANRHSKKAAKAVGKKKEWKPEDFTRSKTGVAMLTDLDVSKELVVKPNNNILINGTEVTLSELNDKIEEANKLMLYNGLDRKYVLLQGKASAKTGLSKVQIVTVENGDTSILNKAKQNNEVSIINGFENNLTSDQPDKIPKISQPEINKADPLNTKNKQTSKSEDRNDTEQRSNELNNQYPELNEPSLYAPYLNVEGDINIISTVTGLSPQKIEIAKEHLMVKKHLLLIDGEIVRQTFEPNLEDVVLWDKAVRGIELTEAETAYLKVFMEHEYQEALQMEDITMLEEAFENGELPNMLQKRLEDLGRSPDYIKKILDGEQKPMTPFRYAHRLAIEEGAANPSAGDMVADLLKGGYLREAKWDESTKVHDRRPGRNSKVNMDPQTVLAEQKKSGNFGDASNQGSGKNNIKELSKEQKTANVDPGKNEGIHYNDPTGSSIVIEENRPISEKEMTPEIGIKHFGLEATYRSEGGRYYKLNGVNWLEISKQQFNDELGISDVDSEFTMPISEEVPVKDTNESDTEEAETEASKIRIQNELETMLAGLDPKSVKAKFIKQFIDDFLQHERYDPVIAEKILNYIKKVKRPRKNIWQSYFKFKHGYEYKPGRGFVHPDKQRQAQSLFAEDSIAQFELETGIKIPEEFRHLFQNHHFIEFKFGSKVTYKWFFKEIGFDIESGHLNGFPLLKDSYKDTLRKFKRKHKKTKKTLENEFPKIDFWEDKPHHRGQHPKAYDEFLNNKLEKIVKDYLTHKDPIKAYEDVIDAIIETKQEIIKGNLRLTK